MVLPPSGGRKEEEGTVGVAATNTSCPSTVSAVPTGPDEETQRILGRRGGTSPSRRAQPVRVVDRLEVGLGTRPRNPPDYPYPSVSRCVGKTSLPGPEVNRVQVCTLAILKVASASGRDLGYGRGD